MPLPLTLTLSLYCLRYMFYFERYKGHADSFKKEKANRIKLLEAINAKMEGGSLEARDYTYLITGLNLLKLARGVLAPTYPFCFHFFSGEEKFTSEFSSALLTLNKVLFEDQQQMLEAEVERLSALIEKCSDTLSIIPQERLAVINSSVSIQERIKRLYDFIESELYGKLQTVSAQISPFRPLRNIAG